MGKQRRRYGKTHRQLIAPRRDYPPNPSATPFAIDDSVDKLSSSHFKPHRHRPKHTLTIINGTVEIVTIIWQRDLSPKFPGALVGYYGSGVFFPSSPQKLPRKPENVPKCSPRLTYPQPGEIEICLAELIKPDKQNPVFIAYPRKDTPIAIAPGIKIPVVINWRPNPKEPGGVIARLPITNPSFNSHNYQKNPIIVLPATEEIINQSPQPDKTIPWGPGDLVPGKRSQCFLKYCFSRRGSLFALAFKAKS